MRKEDITTEAFFTELKKKDKNAFKILYEEFKVPLYNLVISILKDRDKTADIIQDTFIKVIKNIHQLEDIKKIKYWLFRIAVNLTLNAIKKDKRLSYAGDDLDYILDQVTGNPFRSKEDAGGSELYKAVQEEIRKLPIKQRMAFTLKYEDNFKETEISEILVVPVGTVKSRLSVARNKIKEAIERQKPR